MELSAKRLLLLIPLLIFYVRKSGEAFDTCARMLLYDPLFYLSYPYIIFIINFSDVSLQDFIIMDNYSQRFY